YYITDDMTGPLQFANHAGRQGPSTLNLFFGHGNGRSDEVQRALQRLMSKSDPKSPTRPLFGFGSCYATLYNGTIPPAYRIANTPKNTGRIFGFNAPTYWFPMIDEADQIIQARKGQGLTLNLYFGEWT